MFPQAKETCNCVFAIQTTYQKGFTDSQTNLDPLTRMLFNTLCLPTDGRTHADKTSSLLSFVRPRAVKRPLYTSCFIYGAITQREWNSCTCLSISLFPNKFHYSYKTADRQLRGRVGSRGLTSHPTHTRFILSKGVLERAPQRGIVGKWGIFGDTSGRKKE